MKRAEEEPKAKEFQEANIALGNTLRELKKKATQIANDVQDLKTEKEGMEEKIKNNDFLINNAKQEVARLRSRIVHNPEKLKQVSFTPFPGHPRTTTMALDVFYFMIGDIYVLCT